MKKCEKFDEWTECEKRGCQGCFHNVEKYVDAGLKYMILKSKLNVRKKYYEEELETLKILDRIQTPEFKMYCEILSEINHLLRGI